MQQFRDVTDPALAKALAHPLRTRILASLEDRTASPSELAAEFGIDLSLLSYHVRRLEAFGLVRLVKRVRKRGAVEHRYRAVARPRITSDVWGETPAIVKQATIRAALDQVAHYVNAAAASNGFDARESHLTRSPVVLDAEGFSRLAGELDALHDRIRAIEIDSKKRLAHADHRDEQNATVVLMLFETAPELVPPPSSATRARANHRPRARAARS